jgi:hypothetical protein
MNKRLTGTLIDIWSAVTCRAHRFIIASDPEKPGRFWLLRELPKGSKFDYSKPRGKGYQSYGDALEQANQEVIRVRKQG